MTAERGPDFFLIGAQRAGTTRLSGLLTLHPRISMPVKEPAFFEDPDADWSTGAWYRELYRDVPEGVLIGDGSTHYSMCERFPGTAERVHRFNPQAKIVYTVRHPIRRIESAWPQLLSVYHANRVLGFDRTLRETNLLLDPSMYWRQLSAYRSFFPDEQILVAFFEDFAADEQAVIRTICGFLGVDPTAAEMADDRLPRNESAGKQQRALIVDAVRSLPGYERYKQLIPQAIKAYLSEHFTSPIETEVHWDPQTLAWTAAQLREDSDALLRHLGRPSSFWNF